MHLDKLPRRRWIETLIAIGIVLILVAIIVPAIQQARNKARKMTSRNNLHNIGIALHNYHEQFSLFPMGGVVNENGVGMHGWLTQILPFVDSSPLFSKINFKRPWDDGENNYNFRTSRPDYMVLGVGILNTSRGYGLTHYAGHPNVFHRNTCVNIDEMTSGPSNTLMAGEVAGNYKPWGYPFNWRWVGTSLNDGPNSYGRPTGEGAHLLMGDGSIRFVINDVDPAVLTSLSKAPPLAKKHETIIPERRFDYSASPWKRTFVPLDNQTRGPDRMEGLAAVVWNDETGTPHTVLIRSKNKFDARDTTIEDLRFVVDSYPEMRELIGYGTIDDEAAALLASLTQLEVLQAGSIHVSEEGLQSLSKLSHLRFLACGWNQVAKDNLTKALPQCEIR